MHIRVTTDPITMKEVPSPQEHPCIYEGDGNDGLEIYFESEKTRKQYLQWQKEIMQDDHISLQGNDSDEYVAEG